MIIDANDTYFFDAIGNTRYPKFTIDLKYIRYPRAVYNEETGLWRKENDDLSVKNAVKGEKIAQIIEVKADTYPEAFEKLFGYSVFIPAPDRAPRRNAEAS